MIGELSTHTDEAYSSRMFRHLDFLQRELSLELKDFDLLAVAAGPGSFTGLRVGLAAAKGWSEVYRKPIAAVSALEAVAVQSRSPAPLIVPVLDARRGQVYFGFYSRQSGGAIEDLALGGEECVATPEEFLEGLQRRAGNLDFAVISPTPEIPMKAMSADAKLQEGLCIERASSVLAPFIGQIGYRQAQRGYVSDSLTADANYVRRSDAELNWKVPR